MEMLNQKQKIILGIIIVIIIIVIGYYYINSTKEVYTSQNIESIVEENNEIEEEETVNETIVVHITGAVNKNGVMQVEEGARINDVIEVAGGITEDADLTDVNLAYIVQDGQKIYIPSIDDKEIIEEIITEEAGENVIEDEYYEEETIVNINTAGVGELITLPGIGESTAAKIVEYRKTNGKFKTIEDIKNVSGIGDAKFNTIKEFITV